MSSLPTMCSNREPIISVLPTAHNDTSDESYTFTADFTPVVDNREPNNQLGQASLIESTDLTGIIFGRGDEDWYRFEVSQAGQLTVALTSVPSNLMLRFRLYNSSRGHLQSGQPTSAGGLFSLIYDIAEPDTYYLLVDDLDN